ncbi:MAG: alpha/beta hydrolase [Lachnospiraceae bacterium]|nr:alpha/beta hydrolase [Lachnospiraceae bacterium]
MATKGVVQKNGIEMEYCRFGSGSRVFVILPGLSIQSVMGAKDAIENAYSLMKDDFTTYVFDRRKDIPDDYSIYDMADDTAAVMKEMGLNDIYLFGASQGGMIAMAIAIRYPELVKKVVLGSTSPHVKPGQREVIDRWIKLAQKKDRDGLCHEYGKEIYPPDVYEQYKDIFAVMAKNVTDKELERFVILAKSIRDYDVSDELKKIECPVLALGVFEDPVLDSDATMEIAENLDYRADFELYMYKGYGHAAFDTAPDYKNRMVEFLLKD